MFHPQTDSELPLEMDPLQNWQPEIDFSSSLAGDLQQQPWQQQKQNQKQRDGREGVAYGQQLRDREGSAFVQNAWQDIAGEDPERGTITTASGWDGGGDEVRELLAAVVSLQSLSLGPFGKEGR